MLLTADDGYERQEGASADEVGDVATALGAVFPADLSALYRVSNGVFDRPVEWFVVWPLADVLARNRAAWVQEGQARRALVGFGDDGTGAPFCIRRDGSGGVEAWSSIDGASVTVADSVTAFWAGWVGGTLRD